MELLPTLQLLLAGPVDRGMPSAQRLERGVAVRVPIMCPLLTELLTETLVGMTPLPVLAMAIPSMLLRLALLTIMLSALTALQT